MTALDHAASALADARIKTGEASIDIDDVRKQLGLAEPMEPAADLSADTDLEQRARGYAEQLASLDPNDVAMQDEARAAIEGMGCKLQSQAAHRCRMLKQAIAALGEQGADGGPVADALINLKIEVEKLDLQRFDFSAGWFSRLLGSLSGAGTPLSRYFSRLERAQTIFDALVKSLEHGRDQLERDNFTLEEDQRAMRELTLKLEKKIKRERLVDQGLQYKLDREIPEGDPRKTFIGEELLFPLRQRIWLLSRIG
jgi:uncharacterized protein YaaN involved in tellurite resistance